MDKGFEEFKEGSVPYSIFKIAKRRLAVLLWVVFHLLQEMYTKKKKTGAKNGFCTHNWLMTDELRTTKLRGPTIVIQQFTDYGICFLRAKGRKLRLISIYKPAEGLGCGIIRQR